MEVDRPSFLQGLHRASQKADCRSSHSRNSRRVFRLPRRSIKDASVARFVNLKQPTAQTKLRGKSKEGGRSPLLGRFKGIAKGLGSHANPAKRFVWEKEEQRNGRRLSAACGGQDEECGVCSDANPPLPFSFYRQRLFLCRAKKKGLNSAATEHSVDGYGRWQHTPYDNLHGDGSSHHRVVLSAFLPSKEGNREHPAFHAEKAAGI